MAGGFAFKSVPVRNEDVTSPPRAHGQPTGTPGLLRPSQVPVTGTAALIEGERQRHHGRKLRPSAASARRAEPFARPSTIPAQQARDLLPGAGQALASPLKEEMESRLGADFSDVRVHTGAAARASAADVGARAFTLGSHIVIGNGGAGKHTLAHELTHVIQQRVGLVAGAARQRGLRFSDPSDPFEHAAESNAVRAMSGSAPRPQAAPSAGVDEGPQHVAAAAPSPRLGEVVQRMQDLTDKEWKSQSTVLAADLQNAAGAQWDLGKHHSGGGLHAEDSLINLLTQQVAHGMLPAGNYQLLININRSPCSKIMGAKGCAERLVALATHGLAAPGGGACTFAIVLHARHLYGTTQQERAMSSLAIEMMQNAGIQVALDAGYFDIGAAEALSTLTA